MKTPANLLLAAAMTVLVVGPAAAGGARIQYPQQTAHAPDTRLTGNTGGHNPNPQSPPPAGMPSFYQPSYSIETKEWWRPHPYFQSNGQGFGYPTRPVARPHSSYGYQGR